MTATALNVWTITLERISTGGRSPSMVTRQANEDAARAYAEAAIRQSPEPEDLRVVAVEARTWATCMAPCDKSSRAAYHALVGNAAIRQVGWYRVSSGVPPAPGAAGRYRGFQPAMVRAHARACAVSVTAGAGFTLTEA